MDSLNLMDVVYNVKYTLHTSIDFHCALRATDSTKRNVIFNIKYRVDGVDKSEFGQTVTRWP